MTDRNTISNAGRIRTSGAFAFGIRARNNNTITNKMDAGISTEGEFAYGIAASDNNTITNEAGASISTKGTTARGIEANDNSTISNAGSISTEGRDSNGIWASDKNEITNSGRISTTGVNAPGVRARNDNTLTNKTRGVITTRDADAIGILMLNGNAFINEADAAIRTGGANATGIRAGLAKRLLSFFNRPDNGNNRITNDGEVRTGGANAAGIQVVGANNTVTNNGSIHTTGEGAAGLLGITVNTQGRRPEAPRVDVPLTLRPTGTRFTNNGTINTTGANAPGVQVGDKTTVTNSGRIAVTGLGSAGIRAGDGNELTLSGTITSAQGSALILGDNNTVNHSGNKTLRSNGANTPTVVMGSGNTLTNTGTIEATGTGANAHAITGDSNNTINNRGTIKANPDGAGKAIHFTGSGNIINLQAGSVLIGDIEPGAGGKINDTSKEPGAKVTGAGSKTGKVTVAVDKTGRAFKINVSAAPAYSVLWDAIDSVSARPGSGQGLPFFYNAQSRQFATYDPRLLATAAQSLGDVSGNISGLMARPVLASSANTRNLNLSGRAAAFWLSPFGSRARERESGPAGLSPEFTHVGLAGGYDVRLAATQIGVLAGYGRGERVFEGEQRFKPGPGVFKGPFAGLYARQDFARFYVHLGLAGGALQHEHSRLVNDQRGLNGETRAEARTRSWWLAPEARIGWRALDTGLARFEPSLSARYARQSIRAYTETGIRAPAAVGRRTVEMVETRLEMKASREVGPGRLALRLGWQYRNDLNSNRTQVRLLGETRSLRFEPKLGSSVYLGAEAEFELAPGLFFSLNGEAVSGGGYRSLSGMAGLYMRF